MRQKQLVTMPTEPFRVSPVLIGSAALVELLTKSITQRPPDCTMQPSQSPAERKWAESRSFPRFPPLYQSEHSPPPRSSHCEATPHTTTPCCFTDTSTAPPALRLPTQSRKHWSARSARGTPRSPPDCEPYEHNGKNCIRPEGCEHYSLEMGHW